MRYAASLSLAVWISSVLLFGQSATSEAQSPTFHVRGTVRDASGAAVYGVKIAFRNEQASKSMLTNDAGKYEADLPLGSYTMTAAGIGFQPYVRPTFRVTSPASLTFDVVMHASGDCEIPIFDLSGIVTAEEWAAAQKPSCLLEDFFPVPSQDAPFNVSFRYRSRTVAGNTTSYAGPVFVAYNLFSLRADRVTYDSKNKSLQASGHVVAVNEPGTIQRADSIAFTLADGQAIPASQPQTFHVKGTITDATGAVFTRAEIAFHSTGFDKTIVTNQAGVYETDLPLGIYRVSGDYKQMARNYIRPLLRAGAPTRITLDVTLHPMRTSCDIEIAGGDPDQREETFKSACGGEDFFPDSPDRDSLRRICIRYPKRKATNDGYVYGGARVSAFDFDMPVLVEYDLFSLQATQVIYDAKTRTIRANGDVVVVDELGATQHAASLTFKLDNGKATPLPQRPN